MTVLDKHARLFNLIAPVYNLFFKSQVKNYTEIILKNKQYLAIPEKGSVLDIGCGTGAFLYSFAKLGYKGTGVDIAEKMIKEAQKSTEEYPIEFLVGDATVGLPFRDKNFDLVISSYVTHGLKPDLRKRIYREAARLSRGLVLFYEYNQKRSLTTDFIEWAEGGDYFNFIKNARKEMEEAFKEVNVINAGVHTALYICTPKNI